MELLKALYIIWLASAILVIVISFCFKDVLPTVHKVWYHERRLLYFLILCPLLNTFMAFVVLVALGYLGVIILRETISKLFR